MRQNSKKNGPNISECEVTAITPHGIWMIVNGREFFLDDLNYPWFKKNSVDLIFDVTFSHGHLIHWPQLDIDLSIEVLDDPHRFPLIAKV